MARPTRRSHVGATGRPTPPMHVRLAMDYSSLRGEAVLDLFGGSGSTLIAAEQTGRRAYSMEIDPAYCDVILERWQNFTGRQAERVDG
jgi:DNA modification methylase